jgi:hypothetical protein
MAGRIGRHRGRVVVHAPASNTPTRTRQGGENDQHKNATDKIALADARVPAFNRASVSRRQGHDPHTSRGCRIRGGGRSSNRALMGFSPTTRMAQRKAPPGEAGRARGSPRSLPGTSGCASGMGRRGGRGKQPEADGRERDLPGDRRPRPAGRVRCPDTPVPAPPPPHLDGWTAAARKGALKELNCRSYQQMLRRYSASARRTYDHILTGRP